MKFFLDRCAFSSLSLSLFFAGCVQHPSSCTEIRLNFVSCCLGRPYCTASEFYINLSSIYSPRLNALNSITYKSYLFGDIYHVTSKESTILLRAETYPLFWTRPFIGLRHSGLYDWHKGSSWSAANHKISKLPVSLQTVDVLSWHMNNKLYI